MRIAISSLGRFWTFDLARQMIRLKAQLQLYTAYPRFKVDAALRPFTRTFPWVFLFALAAQRAGWHGMYGHLSWLAIDSFDRWVSHQVKPCHLFMHLSSFGLYTARCARKQGARIVCDRGSSHILYQDRILAEEYRRYRLLYRGIDHRIVKKELQEYAQADRMTVPSTFAYRSFVEEGVPKEKLRVLPYGVDLTLFRRHRKRDKCFRVLFVGSYSLRKGIPYLFDAVRHLVKSGAIEMWFMGSPSREAREVLRTNADLFVDKGHHPQGSLSWFYSQGSVLVLPSVEDGFGLVMAQAMACGLPVIATTNTGAADLFTDGKEGFIVPIRDPEAIRERIRWMLDNPKRRQEMGEAALQRVKGLGGWQRYGNQAMGFYRELFDGTGNGRR